MIASAVLLIADADREKQTQVWYIIRLSCAASMLALAIMILARLV